MKQLSNNVQGIIYVALCIFLWSLIPVFAKLGQTSLDHYQYLFYSSVISFFSLLAVALYTKKIHELLKYSGKMYLFLVLLGFLDFFYYLLLYFGYQKSNGLEVLVMQYTWPIFIVLLSLGILKEKLTINKTASLILGFLGVVVVITKGDFASIDLSNMGVVGMVLLGAISFALFSVLSKKVNINLANAVTIYFLTAIIYSFIAMQIFSSFVLPTGKEWFYILINGVFLNGVSYLFWIKALQNADASFVAPFIFITPILSATFLIIVFDEPILPIYFIGLALIVSSGLANSLKKR
ncbi:MAG: DMT family transporter [Sulfurospirillaceae bacterium]|nr:DMT family transporter [Sulfurospirillaceae bacterium]MDD2825579.1 DMT family transporter [Sulfurospirillaceae bacterium]